MFFLCFLVFFSSYVGIWAHFDPYVDHGGTVLGLAGRDYCLLAADTRLSEGYMIHSRNHSRILEVGDSSGCGGGWGLCGSGCWSDMQALGTSLRHNMNVYKWQTRTGMSVEACSNLLSAIMYGRRMFPYFTFSVLGGVDRQGRGALFRYDAVGSFERVRAVCAGKGEALIQPQLDRLTNMEEDPALWRVGWRGQRQDLQLQQNPIQHHYQHPPTHEHPEQRDGNEQSPTEEPSIVDVFQSSDPGFVDVSVEEACELVLDMFRSAAEREISIGDGVRIMVVERAPEGDMVGNTAEVDAYDGKKSTKRRTRTRWLSFPLAKH